MEDGLLGGLGYLISANAGVNVVRNTNSGVERGSKRLALPLEKSRYRIFVGSRFFGHLELFRRNFRIFHSYKELGNKRSILQELAVLSTFAT